MSNFFSNNASKQAMHRMVDRVDFTRSGWRQFADLNRGLGARFMKSYILRFEVAAYIAAHEEQRIHLDQDCQEIHYDSGLYMLLMMRDGVWFITEIWMTNAPGRFVPVYLWQRIKRGLSEWPAKVIVGWRALAGESYPKLGDCLS
jgi:hypothetical protein